MRCLGLFFALFTAVSTAAAQTPDQPSVPGQIYVASDWDRILQIYQMVHGGSERMHEMKLFSFDFAPSSFNEEGVETVFDKRKVTIRFFNVVPVPQGEIGPSEPIPRSVRIDSTIDLSEDGSGKKSKLISMVTPGSVHVWVENATGGFDETRAKELQVSAAKDANAILAHLDMILMPDSEELLFRYVGIRKRDGVDYAAVEAEFSPVRGVPQIYRNYLSPVTSLIERMDVYDPETKRRVGFTRISDYEDHGGIKFPRQFKSYNRDEKPVGTWTFTNVVMDPEVPETHFVKP
jgi:hypothetical protein